MGPGARWDGWRRYAWPSSSTTPSIFPRFTGAASRGCPAGRTRPGLVLGMTKRQIFFKVTLLQMVKLHRAPHVQRDHHLGQGHLPGPCHCAAEVIWAAESFMKGNQGISGLWWPLMFTAVYYLAFSAIVTMVLGRLEKKLDYFRV